MRVPLVDLAREHESIRGELRDAFDQVIDSGTYVLGPHLEDFERNVARYHGVRYAVGVNSCTDALFLALKALGIKKGDEVLVPATTFVATANVVIYCGATPVFVEVEPDTLNIDPGMISRSITKATKAIIVVHFHGHPSDMEPILNIAKRHELAVVEDCAQAFGAEYSSRKVGSLSTVGCLSFYPTKHLGALGDGGMVITNDEGIYEEVCSLRNYGETRKYTYEKIGYNTRLDELQAAMLNVKIKYIDGWIRKRRALAGRYKDLLKGTVVKVPIEKAYAKHVYWVYSIKLPTKTSRDRVQEYLAQRDIQTHIFYPVSVPNQEAYRFITPRANQFLVSRHAADRMLALPLFPELTDEEQEYVVKILLEAIKECERGDSNY